MLTNLQVALTFTSKCSTNSYSLTRRALTNSAWCIWLCHGALQYNIALFFPCVKVEREKFSRRKLQALHSRLQVSTTAQLPQAAAEAVLDCSWFLVTVETLARGDAVDVFLRFLILNLHFLAVVTEGLPHQLPLLNQRGLHWGEDLQYALAFQRLFWSGLLWLQAKADFIDTPEELSA